MINYTIKSLSKISPKGLARLENTACSLVDSSEEPDGILIRSQVFVKADIKDSLKAISRAGVGVNNIPIDLCT